MNEFAVSVIIPVYNAGRHLECAVQSALQQPEVGEVVLVNDGSTDDTITVAERLREAHPGRVQVVGHDGGVQKGPGASRNLGLEKSRCPFVAFLDADDWYLPGHFQFDREAFGRDPQLGMVRHPLGNGWDPNDPEQQWFVAYTGKARAQAKFYSRVENTDPAAYFASLYPMGDVVSGVADTLTIRRRLLDAVGGFPDRDWAEDAAMHLKLAALGTIAFADMSEPLAMRRIHADNLSRRKAGQLSARIDAMGQTLLDVADFAGRHRLAWGIRNALHIGWIRFGSRYTRYPSYAMLVKWPWALLSPRVFLAYARMYAWIGFHMLKRMTGRVRRALRPPDGQGGDS